MRGRIIDLTLQIYPGMPVYPGDPEVTLRPWSDLGLDGFRLTRITLGSHTGTHVNVPSHMSAHGESLSDLSLERFCGPCRVITRAEELGPGEGGIIREPLFDPEFCQKVLVLRPRFLAFSHEIGLSFELERLLLNAGIINFENLANTAELPENQGFWFAGLPLSMQACDGSPVRALAIVD